VREKRESYKSKATKNMASFNQQRLEWKTKKAIMLAVIEKGGYVFGGAVRDWVLHEDGAEHFYKALDMKDKTAEEIDALYNDANCMPDFAHRTVMPVDIDACIHASDLVGFLRKLKQKKMVPTRIFTHDPVEYIPGIELKPDEVRHMRYKVSMVPNLFSAFSDALMRELEPMLSQLMEHVDAKMQGMTKHVTMDLMVVNVPKDQKQPVAPFGNLDFECNGLIASEHGIRLSKYLHNNFNPMDSDKEYRRITNDILCKRAVLTNNARDKGMGARVQKMLAKGWTITGFSSVEYVKKPKDANAAASCDDDVCDDDACACNELGHCLICHGGLQTNHYKMGCCNGRFHLECLVQGMTTGVTAMTQTEKCLMCKRRLLNPANDLKVLRAIAACV